MAEEKCTKVETRVLCTGEEDYPLRELYQLRSLLDIPTIS